MQTAEAYRIFILSALIYNSYMIADLKGNASNCAYFLRIGHQYSHITYEAHTRQFVLNMMYAWLGEDFKITRLP
jgi:hypothetical protein